MSDPSPSGGAERYGVALFPELVSIDDLVAELRVSRATVGAWFREGGLPGVKMSRWWCERAAFLEWFRARASDRTKGIIRPNKTKS